MKEIFLPPELSRALADIYLAMESHYQVVAAEIELTCRGCPDNCCDSYFLHHTYCEWAYLWEGLRTLDDGRFDMIMARATAYVEQSRKSLQRGARPQIMCPCNEDGLCLIYSHRMMICRMHGIPASLVRPDGQDRRFPGCFRCQEIVRTRYGQQNVAPAMDRTALFRQLAALEGEFLGDKRGLYPRVKLTIAELLVAGPPRAEKLS